MRLHFYLTAIVLGLLLNGCAARKHKDIDYAAPAATYKTEAPKLNVFTPRIAREEKMPVLIFIHGGNWNTGNKDTYGFLGRNFAKKGIITVIPDYTLSPEASYNEMAMQMAATIKWVKANIAKYNGDPEQLFITGHSAGGHLAALAVMNPKYGIANGLVKGIILNDAAGLDMKYYLDNDPPNEDRDYLTTWTADPANWRDASPAYFLDRNTPRLMIYIGEKTYRSIKITNDRFLEALQPYQPGVRPIYLNKGHIPMVLQYFWPWNDRYDEIIGFIKEK